MALRSSSLPSGEEPEQEGAPILRVGEVSGAIRELLEGTFPYLRVQGEVSGLSRPQSGHLYFSLIDDVGGAVRGSRQAAAQLPCVVWRSDATRLRLDLENGMRVVATGRIGVYEPRGTYQLIARRLEPIGLGELQRRFDELKKRLHEEGLFEVAQKQPLPAWPRRIGLVTSPSGAAIQDFLRILYRRDPRAAVRLVPVLVQGEGAAEQIAGALETLDRHGDVDVIVLTRGGGSLEDLWAFNEESVARAIAACRVPVVSAVGHEVDFTIADFVADARAQTPTHASELVVPDRVEVRERLAATARRLRVGAHGVFRRAAERWERLALRRAYQDPEIFVEERVARCDDLAAELRKRLASRATRWEDSVRALAGRLEALSPLRVLARGYAVALDETGRAVRDAREVDKGDRLRVVLSRGELQARVEVAADGAVDGAVDGAADGGLGASSGKRSK